MKEEDRGGKLEGNGEKGTAGRSCVKMSGRRRGVCI